MFTGHPRYILTICHQSLQGRVGRVAMHGEDFYIAFHPKASVRLSINLESRAVYMLLCCFRIPTYVLDFWTSKEFMSGAKLTGDSSSQDEGPSN